MPPGSSPRVRGKRGRAVGVDPARRLIPARAGKTPVLMASAASDRAHPRACGENGSHLLEGPSGAGSSPRVRGKRGLVQVRHGPPGLIPARAGKTICTGPT